MISTNPHALLSHLQQAYNIAGQRGLPQSAANVTKIAKILKEAAATPPIVENLRVLTK
ncbi:MAG: hypothetical protein ACKO34_04370 [Vampirovibrionales bacterium]